ncbi:MAG: phosphoribosylaminoimidazolesuccinocarboxamide synthase [bacterium]|nr:phosphoribosylaminoimidazolesuccinocarboxamide synthase [bacterium]
MASSTPKQRPFVHQGSVKVIERENLTTIAFRHTDKFSVFDVGSHPQEIPRMGNAVFRCSMASDRLLKAAGLQTAVVGQDDGDVILVHEVSTPKDRPLLPSETNVMPRIEWLDRDYVAGSLGRDFRSGKKKPSDYGFADESVPPDGTRLPFPHHEATTKWEDVDRPMTNEETLAYAGLTVFQWRQGWRVINYANGILGIAAKAAGFRRLDGKKEMALVMVNGILMWMFIDALGNPNEDRYAPSDTLRPGYIDHYSKEWLRQLFIANGYKKVLDEARKAGQPDPDYPLLKDEDITEASRRYTLFADSYEAAVNRILG